MSLPEPNDLLGPHSDLVKLLTFGLLDPLLKVKYSVHPELWGCFSVNTQEKRIFETSIAIAC